MKVKQSKGEYHMEEKNMKKLLKGLKMLAAAAVMVLLTGSAVGMSVLPVSASGEDSEYGTYISESTSGDCICTLYDQDGDGTADTLVISGNGAMQDYTSSSSKPWGGVSRVVIEYGVTRIGSNTFYQNANITSVEIKTNAENMTSVTSIGDFAFWEAYNLNSMNFPRGIKTIGTRALEKTFALKSIVLPEGLETLGVQAFRVGSDAVKDFVIVPSTVTGVGYKALGGYYSVPKYDKVYWLATAVEMGDFAEEGMTNSAYKITLNMDGVESFRYVLPAEVAAGTDYEGTRWDASMGFPYTEEELRYEWTMNDDVDVKYNKDNKASLSGDATFYCTTYERRAVSFVTEKVTVTGDSVAKGGVNGEDYTCILTPDTNYMLEKDDITVAVGENTLATDSYTFDAAAYTLTIPKEQLTDKITITAAARLDESKYVVRLTKEGDVSRYFSFKEAAAALNGTADARTTGTLTLLQNCPMTEETDFVYSDVTLDLAGFTLGAGEIYLGRNHTEASLTILSSAEGGKLAAGSYIRVENQCTLTLGENVEAAGSIEIKDNTSGLQLEGATVSSLRIVDGNCRILSGRVGELDWRDGSLTITGGIVDSMNTRGKNPGQAFPDGYGVKNPASRYRYTREELGAEDFAGSMEAYQCTDHENHAGYCKYCHTMTVCDHIPDTATGVCQSCGIQILASLAGEEGMFFVTWENLRDWAAKLEDGRTYTVIFYADAASPGDEPIEFGRGVVVLDLGGNTITHPVTGSYFLNISGTADVTIENGTLACSDRGYLISITGGSLKLEEDVVLSWERVLYGPCLNAAGGETVISGAAVEGTLDLNGGRVTVLDGCFNRICLISGELVLQGGKYLSSSLGSGIKSDIAGGIGVLPASGYGFRSLTEAGTAGGWIYDVASLEAGEISNVIVEKLPEMTIEVQPEDMTALLTKDSSRYETLSVTAMSDKELTYCWYLVGTDGAADTEVNGETAAVLSLDEQPVGTVQTYYCVITCDGYPFKSEQAVVTWKNNLADCGYTADSVFGYFAGEATKLETDTLQVFYTKEDDTAVSLTEGTDYEIDADSYRNNTAPTADGAKASVKLRGIGNYGGELTVEFPVKNYDITAEASLTDGNGTAIGAGAWANDILVKAPDGYLISSTQDGTYTESFEIETEGETEVAYYLMEKQHGYISTVRTIVVKSDKTAPAWEAAAGEGESFGISVRNIWWKRLLNIVSFGRLYNDTATDIVFKASDAKEGMLTVSGVAKYYYYIDTVDASALQTPASGDGAKTAAARTKAELDVLKASGGFTEIAAQGDGTATVSGALVNEKYYVIYVCAADAAGNISDYICSEGVVIDTTAPQLSAIEAPSKAAGTLADYTAAVRFEADEAGTLVYFYIGGYDDDALFESNKDVLEALKADYPNAMPVKNVDGKWQPAVENGQEFSISTISPVPVIYSQSMQAGENEIILSGLKANKGYRVYLMSVDEAGNLQAEYKTVDFTTLRPLPEVTVKPVLSGIYGTQAKNFEITGGTVMRQGAQAGEAALTGTWTFTDAAGDEYPAPGTTKEYTVTFSPDKSDEYDSVTVKVIPTVKRAKPYIETAPTATAVVYGDTLDRAALSGGNVLHGDGMGNASALPYGSTKVEGTFTWKQPSVKPAVADSESTEYTVIFTPTDSVAYETAEINIKLTVNKAENAPDMPGSIMNVSYTCKRVSDVRLAGGWTWQDSDRDTVLEVGAEVTATAVYTGADKDNYENLSVSVKLTRSDCTHSRTVVRNSSDATCTEDGYTGDRYCRDCDELVESGYELSATGHTGGTATCTKKAVCESCHNEYGTYNAANHAVTEIRNTRSATCTEAGYTGDTCCADCGALLARGIVVPATGHTGGTATCTKKAVCGICNREYGEPDAANHTHTEIRNVKAATCTEDGYTGNTCCKECGTLIMRGAVKKAEGHRYTEYITKQPTAAEEGVRTYSCSVCGYSYSEAIERTAAPDTGKPFIKGNDKVQGWDIIREDIKTAKDGDGISVDMNGTTAVPGDIFDSIRGKDITIVFDMGKGITWSVNGRDVTADKTGDIDFGVKFGAEADGVIPADVINQVTGERFYAKLSLSHNGEFGFKSVLSLKTDAKNAGLYANLYYFNEQTGGLEFVCADRIEADGGIELTFTHASEYIIVIAEDVLTKEPETDAGEEEPQDTVAPAAQTETRHMLLPVLIIAAVLAAGIVVFIVVRRKKETK